MSASSLSPARRELIAATAAAGAISLFPGTLQAVAADESIRPFRINFPEERSSTFAATRWPDRETVSDRFQDPAGESPAAGRVLGRRLRLAQNRGEAQRERRIRVVSQFEIRSR